TSSTGGSTACYRRSAEAPRRCCPAPRPPPTRVSRPRPTARSSRSAAGTAPCTRRPSKPARGRASRSSPLGPEKERAMPTVVIDPGHGGATATGGSSPNNATGPNGLLEKDLTLDLGRRVSALLAPRATVILTRTTDVNLSL